MYIYEDNFFYLNDHMMNLIIYLFLYYYRINIEKDHYHSFMIL